MQNDSDGRTAEAGATGHAAARRAEVGRAHFHVAAQKEAALAAGGTPSEADAARMVAEFHAKGGRSGWWRRLSWDLPSPTVVTLPNHASTAMCHPDEVRVLSVGECARIQEFPDGWTFTGNAAEQMTQVGNAVPVRLGMVAGELVAAHLADPALGTGVPDAPVFRRVYLDSHVRTRQWFKAGTVYVWDDAGTARYGGARAG